MSKQRFEVNILFEVRETTTSEGTPSIGMDGQPGKPFCEFPARYSDMPYAGLVAIEQQVLNVMENLLGMGIVVSKAISENKDNNDNECERDTKYKALKNLMSKLPTKSGTFDHVNPSEQEQTPETNQ